MKFLPGIGLNVILLGIVSFITDISSEMMLAILPMFIISLSGTGLAVGLIGGLGDGVSSILNVFSGIWSDKVGKRKIFAISGYFISSCAKLLFPFSQRWWNLLILRPLERIGKGIRSAPRDAIIGDSCLPETKGKAFGIHRAADTSGAVVGVLLVFILYWQLNLDFKPILIISAILSFLALIPFFWIKERGNYSPRRTDAEVNNTSLMGISLNLKGISVGFKDYLVVVAIFSLANFTYMFFILQAVGEFKGFLSVRLSKSLPILLYLWFNIIYAMMAVPAGILADKIGRKKVLAIGYITYSLTCISFVLSCSIVQFIISFALYGLFFALIEANQRAFASDFATQNTKGTVLGVFHTTVSLSTIAGGIIAGLLWNCNPDWTFIYGASLGLLAALIILFFRRKGTEMC